LKALDSPLANAVHDALKGVQWGYEYARWANLDRAQLILPPEWVKEVGQPLDEEA
jgi:hypothetical protein